MRCYSKAALRFDCFSDLEWPDQKAFRQSYVSLLPEFEVRRLASSNPQAIAKFLAEEMQAQLVLGDVSIDDAMQQCHDALPLNTVEGQATSHWQPCFEHDGRNWHNFAELGETLFGEGVISREAAASLTEVQSSLLEGGLDLTRRKVCVIGAAAEMASTLEFLKTGADVLWLDRMPPHDEFIQEREFSGTLYYPQGNVDLWQGPGGACDHYRVCRGFLR